MLCFLRSKGPPLERDFLRLQPPLLKDTVMTRTRYTTDPDINAYFVTSTIVDWIPLFSRPELAEIVIESLNFLHNKQRMRIHAYVIMQEHLHLISSADNYAAEMRNFKSYTARLILDHIENRNWKFFLQKLKEAKMKFKYIQKYQVWQEGFHPQCIRDIQMYQRCLEYIHMNPVKRGYVDVPEHWRYSSARNYMGESGVVEVDVIEPY